LTLVGRGCLLQVAAVTWCGNCDLHLGVSLCSAFWTTFLVLTVFRTLSIELGKEVHRTVTLKHVAGRVGL
jgi:hypothetical protein